MNLYNGIAISEHRLLVHSILFTVLFICLLVVVAFWIHTILSMRNKKNEQHIKKLKEKAKNDELAKKQLEKIGRKKKRRRKESRHNSIFDAVLLSVCICLAIVILSWCVIPGWADYFAKDYIVYTGEIKVYAHMRHSRIELDDGTTVWGRGNFDEDDSFGTVIYSRRTKRLLGGCD